MALISSIDGPTRRIYLDASTVGTEIHPVDIYKEMRTLRKNNEDLRKHNLFLSAHGNEDKGGGKATERYVKELEGTRIIPFDTSHELTIIGTIITDDGQEGIACFDRTPLSPTTVVDINYVPPQVEVIVVNTGSGLSTEQATQLEQIHGQVPRETWLDENLITPPLTNGYQQTPWDVLNDAIDDLENNNLSQLNTKSDITLARDLKNIRLVGIGLPSPKIDAAGNSLKGLKLWNMQLEGLSTDPFIIQQSTILQGAGLQGTVELCVFKGDAILTGNLEIINGVSGKEGAGFVWLDINGYLIQVSRWTRSLGISNMTDGIHTIAMRDGQLHLDAGCSGGIIYLRGSYSKPPNIDPAATTIVIDQTEKAQILGTEIFPHV